MLAVQFQSDDSLPSVVGSATSSGSVSGYEVFQWTTFGQEASVPLETRTSNDFVLVFDDTNGLTTGVALANAAKFPEDVTVILRDDTGAFLQTASIHLEAQGHTSFLLPTAFPNATNVRGIVDFVAPLFGKISVTELRAKSDGTLTTIPAFTR